MKDSKIKKNTLFIFKDILLDNSGGRNLSNFKLKFIKMFTNEFKFNWLYWIHFKQCMQYFLEVKK